jgi:cleavage and polyadenylation specificity factor subunit 3
MAHGACEVLTGGGRGAWRVGAGPCVVMASPGMLQSGMSRQLFDMWCQDEKNACVVAGYCVEGTLAKFILTEPKEVTLMSGLQVPLKMSVHYISFSAHADYTQTAEFLSILKVPNVLLVHGEAGEMNRLKSALAHKFQNEGAHVQLLNPKNCQTVQLRFKGDKVCGVPHAPRGWSGQQPC